MSSTKITATTKMDSKQASNKTSEDSEQDDDEKIQSSSKMSIIGLYDDAESIFSQKMKPSEQIKHIKHFMEKAYELGIRSHSTETKKKRAPSGYTFFQKEWKKTHDKTSFKDFTTKCSADWKKLSDDKKAEYKAKATSSASSSQ
ncbi:MAG: hypothetical protein MUO21_09855 [Nitrososphaeraceae archaeon]|nr:hypothetical protein [Nitrososphaeraceae archaeon]